MNKNAEHVITARYQGETFTLTIGQWSKKTGIPEYILNNRIQRNWDAERAVYTPYYAHKTSKRGNLSDKSRKSTAKVYTAIHDNEKKTMSIREWAELLGQHRQNLYHLLNRGRSIQEVIDYYEDKQRMRRDINDKTEK